MVMQLFSHSGQLYHSPEERPAWVHYFASVLELSNQGEQVPLCAGPFSLPYLDELLQAPKLVSRETQLHVSFVEKDAQEHNGCPWSFQLLPRHLSPQFLTQG